MQLDQEIVSRACDGLADFCLQQKVFLPAYVIAKFAIAWREGHLYEWNVNCANMRRIYTVPDGFPKATVQHDNGVDDALTIDLSGRIAACVAPRH